jgi:hypothetical protein
MKTRSEHVPGPWQTEVFTSPPYRYSESGTWIYGANGIHVATVQTNLEATDADARLIAAAPDLFAMVRRFAIGDMRLPHTEYEMALRAEARALLARIEEGD